MFLYHGMAESVILRESSPSFLSLTGIGFCQLLLIISNQMSFHYNEIYLTVELQ